MKRGTYDITDYCLDDEQVLSSVEPEKKKKKQEDDQFVNVFLLDHAQLRELWEDDASFKLVLRDIPSITASNGLEPVSGHHLLTAFSRGYDITERMTGFLWCNCNVNRDENIAGCIARWFFRNLHQIQRFRRTTKPTIDYEAARRKILDDRFDTRDVMPILGWENFGVQLFKSLLSYTTPKPYVNVECFAGCGKSRCAMESFDCLVRYLKTTMATEAELTPLANHVLNSPCFFYVLSFKDFPVAPIGSSELIENILKQLSNIYSTYYDNTFEGKEKTIREFILGRITQPSTVVIVVDDFSHLNEEDVIFESQEPDQFQNVLCNMLFEISNYLREGGHLLFPIFAGLYPEKNTSHLRQMNHLTRQRFSFTDYQIFIEAMYSKYPKQCEKLKIDPTSWIFHPELSTAIHSTAGHPTDVGLLFKLMLNCLDVIDPWAMVPNFSRGNTNMLSYNIIGLIEDTITDDQCVAKVSNSVNSLLKRKGTLFDWNNNVEDYGQFNLDYLKCCLPCIGPRSEDLFSGAIYSAGLTKWRGECLCLDGNWTIEEPSFGFDKRLRVDLEEGIAVEYYMLNLNVEASSIYFDENFTLKRSVIESCVANLPKDTAESKKIALIISPKYLSKMAKKFTKKCSSNLIVIAQRSLFSTMGRILFDESGVGIHNFYRDGLYYQLSNVSMPRVIFVCELLLEKINPEVKLILSFILLLTREEREDDKTMDRYFECLDLSSSLTELISLAKLESRQDQILSRITDQGIDRETGKIFLDFCPVTFETDIYEDLVE